VFALLRTVGREIDIPLITLPTDFRDNAGAVQLEVTYIASAGVPYRSTTPAMCGQ
jgi:hypothetical protein